MTTQNPHGLSFYLFDFDDNIMFLQTPIFLLNTVTRETVAIATKDFPTVQLALGKPGAWENYAIFAGTYSHFCDVPADRTGQPQYFGGDIQAAIESNPSAWKGPSWNMFVHACDEQRPLSIITARGHSVETLREGVKILVDRGLITRRPNYHTVFPVGNPEVRRDLGDTDLMMTIPALKKRAIIRSVDLAISSMGLDSKLHFGMSDDDPQNVQLIIAAMCECKKKYPMQRFFVINTHTGEDVKLEVFPMAYAVTKECADGKR